MRQFFNIFPKYSYKMAQPKWAACKMGGRLTKWAGGRLTRWAGGPKNIGGRPKKHGGASRLHPDLAVWVGPPEGLPGSGKKKKNKTIN